MKTKLLEDVLERVETWPKERQEDAAWLLMAMEAQDASPYRLTDEQREQVRAALKEVERGEFASDEEVAAVFDRYRRT
jgi:predicted transcriptional regulator